MPTEQERIAHISEQYLRLAEDRNRLGLCALDATKKSETWDSFGRSLRTK